MSWTPHKRLLTITIKGGIIPVLTTKSRLSFPNLKPETPRAKLTKSGLVKGYKGHNINTLREIAYQGKFECCQDCPRHPSKGNTVFAEGCPEHQTENSPMILFVMRDPSSPQRKEVIGCSTDGRVCPWCHTDISANNFREKLYPLIEKIVPRLRKDKKGRRPIYCINSVLHGPKQNSQPSFKAIKACSHILRAYVRLLQPKLVIALGVEARNSLAYTFHLTDFEKASQPILHRGIGFWWSFHQAPRSFNRNRQEIERRFRQIGEYLATH